MTGFPFFMPLVWVALISNLALFFVDFLANRGMKPSKMTMPLLGSHGLYPEWAGVFGLGCCGNQ